MEKGLKLTKKDFHLLSPISDSFSLLSYFQNPRPPTHIIYGFLPYWRLFEVDSLKLNDLTDIAYFGLRINADGSFQQYVNSYELEPGYNNWRNNKELKSFINKAKRHGVRVALTVISHEDSISDAFLYCETCWSNLGDNLIEELNYHNLTDVNLNPY